MADQIWPVRHSLLTSVLKILFLICGSSELAASVLSENLLGKVISSNTY